MNIHESFAPVEHDYIEEKLGKVQRETQAIAGLFRMYVETGEEQFLTWAWENIAFLADRENSIGREWDYITDRHDEQKNKTRESRLGAENVEVV